MDLLLALALVAGIVFAALVFMLVVVVLGGVDVKPLQSEKVIIYCPYCVNLLIPDPDYATPQSPKRGLLECPTCDRTFKKYRTQNGLEVLEEVFGTPLPIDPRDEK